MAEAVGLAASIAGLVQLTGSVFKLVTKFCKEAKDAPSKAQELATQARELAGILENLRLLATSLESRDSDCSLKTQYLESCQQTLDGIHGKLDKAQADFESGKSTRRFSRRLRWPFSLSDTKDLVADLANHRANLHLALSADSMDTLLKSLTKQDEICNMIERKLSFETRVQLNKRRKEILDFFLRVKPQDYLDVSRDLRHEATGSWLTRGDSTFTTWKNGSNSKLWLSGIAGSGKTVLCGLVIETVLKESDDSTAVCYAFCDYKNPDSCLPENIMAALAVQLSLQCEDAFDLLEEYFDMLHPEDKLPAQPKMDELLELMQRLSSAYDKVFVVVDGLDECGDHVSRMTQSLKSLVDRSELISAAFFSRKEEEIREELEDEFEHIEIFAHTKDLENYTLAEVSKRKVLKNVERTNPALYKDMIQTLVQGAQGMFRWVSCQIDHICDQPSNNARRKALKELPPTLYGTYGRVLQRIMQCPTETQTCIKRALQWIALGYPKMEIPALCEAVSIREGVDDIDEDSIIEPEVISRRCGCLLRKSLDVKYFEFAHFTVLEYLTQADLIGDFRYIEKDAYQAFAETAARFLLFPCFDRVPTLSETVELAYRNEKARKHPFYQSAAGLLVDLTRHRNTNPTRSRILEEEPVLTLLNQLFDTGKNGHFRSWAQTAFSTTSFALSYQLSVSPLHMASCFTSPKFCSLLLEQGTDVNMVTSNATPLCMAIGAIQQQNLDYDPHRDAFWNDRHTQTLSMLLDYGADASFLVDGKSCLAQAFELVRGPSLVAFIRPSTAIPEDAIVAFRDRKWNDPSDEQLLQSILEISTGNDAPPQWKAMAAPALIHSRGRGLASRNNVAKLLSTTYSDVDFPKALEVSIEAGLTEELSKLTADPRFLGIARESGPTAFILLSAAAKSSLAKSRQTAEILLDSGLKPKVVDSSNQNCLHVSCEYGNKDVARVLIARGVGPASTNEKGETPWHLAASNGHSDILQLLFREDESALHNLATLNMDGRTPLCVALEHGHVGASLSLLELCPSEPLYFRSSKPLLHDAAMTGSRELFSAILAKGVVDTEIVESESTPMHHLSASCTAEFVQYMKTMFDPLGLDASQSPPFEQFFRRWIVHNQGAEAVDTIPLDGEVLQLLLPDNFDFVKDGRDMHTWEIICAIIARKDVCCWTATRSESDNSSDNSVCEYYFARDLRTILKQGVLASYENTRKCGGILPLVQAFIQHDEGHFCNSSVATLISEVMTASSINVSLGDVDEGYQLLRKAIANSALDLISMLIDYGVDIHRQLPIKTSNESPRSLFEIACSEADLPTFEAILAAVSSNSLTKLGPTGQSSLELVVEGTSSDKCSMARALCNKGVDPKEGNLATLILDAADREDWSLVRCLADLGVDIFVKNKFGWGLAHFAVSRDDLNMLKWVIESASECSQWQTHCELHWKSPADVAWKRTLHDTGTSLLHMATDNPSILIYLLEQHIFVDVNITTQRGRTPLHFAAFLGQRACCQILLDNDADVAVRDHGGKLPIEYALDSGCADIVSLFLKAGSPFPHEQPRDVGDIVWKLFSNEGLELAQRGYFEKAILAGNLAQCKMAVSHGCSIDQPLPSCCRCTPLFAAVRTQREDIINWLLQRGASTVNVICRHIRFQDIVTYAAFVLTSARCMDRILSAAFNHQTVWHTVLTDAICLSVAEGKIETLEVILKHFKSKIEEYYNAWGLELDADTQVDSMQDFESRFINQQTKIEALDGQTPLHSAVARGDLAIAKMLIHHGAKVDSQDKRHLTPLMRAALLNHLTVAKKLLAHGASIEARDSAGNTAMSFAVSRGNVEMVKFLDLESAFSLQVMTVSGLNLLSIHATGQSGVEIFNYLISRGVELHRYDRGGDSMLMRALTMDRSREYLIHSRLAIPPLVRKSRKLNNPFSQAASECSPSLIKRFYLSLPPEMAGVLINQEDSFYGTPLCAAASRDGTETVKSLLALGANVEQVGSAFGTPIMCAIACGKLGVVKELFRRGAKLQYTGEDGNYKSGLTASLPHPSVTQWLLVGRYQDQYRLTNGLCDGKTELRVWSGKRAIRVELRGSQLRHRHESTIDYCVRLHGIKRGLIGRRVSGSLV